jgi:hypothetical protein
VASDETEGHPTAHQNADLFKEGNTMKPSIQDEVAGKIHEVKGKVK